MKFPAPITISDATGQVFSFEKLEVFTSFLKTEIKFWEEKAKEQQETKGYVNQYLTSYIEFQNILSTMKEWKTQFKNWDEATYVSQITTTNSKNAGSLPPKWIWSGHPFIKSWIDSYSLSQATGEAFIQVILTKSIPNYSNYEWFRGYLLAYEYELQEESSITKRRIAEQEAFNHLRQELSTKKNELVGEVATFQSDIEKWRINEEAAVTTLKNTYIEELRLKGPAQYWNERAKKCKAQGRNWALLLGLVVVLSGYIFITLMSAWLHSYKTPLNLNSLEGAVIFASILSLIAFAIKSLSKLTFSAFHLQRDAEEREQLTHLYLALSKDNKIDIESRNIVLQALFSRSETGLLAGEGGPTMPTVQDAFKIIKS